MRSFPIISLLTDFGVQDPYVAIMKAVILSIHPQVQLVDITHQIPLGAVGEAAVLLEQSFRYFPSGSVHLAVVDPGVGGPRRPIALRAGDHFFVGPDNGLFWPIVSSQEKARVYHLTETKFFRSPVSATFHGRDIFAPTAAHLSKGIALEQMGRPISDLQPLNLPEVRRDEDSLIGYVIQVDRFGNLITNIRKEDLDGFLGASRPLIRVGKLVLEGLYSSYTEKGRGEALALIDSFGRLEIAAFLDRASDLLGEKPSEAVGMKVTVNRIQGTPASGSHKWKP